MTTAEAGVTLTAGDGDHRLGLGGAGLAQRRELAPRRARLSAERRWKAWRLDLRAGLVGRAFGYSESLALGFFNPRSYRYGGRDGRRDASGGGARSSSRSPPRAAGRR